MTRDDEAIALAVDFAARCHAAGIPVTVSAPDLELRKRVALWLVTDIAPTLLVITHLLAAMFGVLLYAVLR